MKSGKQRIYNLPIPDITTIGIYADQLQKEALARGEVLPAAIRLQLGEPDFRTPEHIRQAAIDSINSEAQTYGPTAGWPWLRELLVTKIASVNGYQIKTENVALTQGGTGAIMAALIATVGPGDEVLIPDPCWPIYHMQLAACGATGIPYPLNPHNDWLPDSSLLDALVTPRTRMIIINTPGNPTGAVFPANTIHEMLAFAQRHDLYLLSDESYDEIIFEGEHISPATLLSRDEFEAGRFIGIYTFSKTYAMTGWRIGYVVAGTQLLKTIIDVLNGSITNINLATQRAAVAALTGSHDCVISMRASYQRRRDLAISVLKDSGRYMYTPHGAFYILIDVTSKDGQERRGRSFALDLLRDCNITVTPGNGFGSISDPYVRISLSVSEEKIIRGVHEICLFADR